jgi:hypothetical protein
MEDEAVPDAFSDRGHDEGSQPDAQERERTEVETEDPD